MSTPTLIQTWADSLNAPAWALILAAGVAVVLAIAAVARVAQVMYRGRVRRQRAEQDQAGAEKAQTRAQVRARAWETVADRWTNGAGLLVSVASMWNLYGYIHDAAVPALIAGILVLAFDGGAIGLVASMYRLAEQGTSSKPTMRFSWMLVSVSAAANFAHAGKGSEFADVWLLKVIMGAAPVLAAAFVKHNLRVRLHAKQLELGKVEDEGQPGPLRLVVTVWRQGWTWVFDALGIDAGASTGDQARRAQVRRAAQRTMQHRVALEAYEAVKEHPRKAKGAAAVLETARKRSQLAQEQAEIATDDDQRLAYVRHMAWLTSGDTVAAQDYQDSDAVLDLLDTLAVADRAELVNAQARAAEENAKADRAAAARDAAEAAQDEAETKAKAAREEEATARRELEDARREVTDARNTVEHAREDADREAQRAENARKVTATAREEEATARRELEDARRGITEAAGHVEAARREATDARNAAKTARDQEATARRELEDLNRRAETVRRELGDTETARGQHAGVVERLQRQAAELAQQIKHAAAQRDEHATAVQRAEEARKEAENRAISATQDSQQLEERADEARAALRALGAAVADQLGESPEDIAATLPAGDEPMFRSEGMEGAWRKFRAVKRDHGAQFEPSARELAELGGVAESRARAWLTQFRQLHPRVIAAEQARDAAERGHEGPAARPSTGERSTVLRLPEPSNSEQIEGVAGHPAAV